MKHIIEQELTKLIALTTNLTQEAEEEIETILTSLCEAMNGLSHEQHLNLVPLLNNKRLLFTAFYLGVKTGREEARLTNETTGEKQ